MTREEKVTQLGDRCKKRSCMWSGCLQAGTKERGRYGKRNEAED